MYHQIHTHLCIRHGVQTSIVIRGGGGGKKKRKEKRREDITTIGKK
jgi:hypothetical protein